MSAITYRQITTDEDPATIASAIDCIVDSFSQVEMNMVVANNDLAILRKWGELSLQRVLKSLGGAGEVYLAFDEDKQNKVVGVAMWKVPKDLAGNPPVPQVKPLEYFQPMWDMMPKDLADWWAEEVIAQKDALYASTIGQETLDAAWHLAGLCVHPDYQGRGIAKKVMEPCVQKAQKQGRNMTLETGRDVTVKMYEHMGFRVKGKVDFSPPAGGDYPLWTMLAEPHISS